MRKYIYTFSVLILLCSLLSAAEGKKYGKDLTLSETTKISDILSNPAEFEGKKVLVEGLVVNVCEKRGCWIELSSDKEYESIRVKVNDGEIVFPLEAKGEKALVEGEVYSFIVEEESECSGKTSESCSDKKESDESAKACCDKDKKEKKVYQIKGAGAVI